MTIREQPEGFIEPVVRRTAKNVQWSAHAEYYPPMTPQDPDPPIPPPLKRHAVLQPLSREHMGGLIQARNLQRAADMTEPDRLRAIGEFMDTWRAEIKEHFDDEERLLLPLTDSPEMRQRLLHEHHALRDLANQCEHNPAAVAADAPAAADTAGQDDDSLGLLQRFPPEVRTVVWLRVVEGWTHRELAGRFGRSESWSKSLVSRALARMREMIEVEDDGRG